MLLLCLNILATSRRKINMDEKEVKVTNSNGDWSDEYKGDKPKNDSKYFSDTVPTGDIVYTTKFKFLSEGNPKENKWGNKSIEFKIEHDGKEKVLEISGSNFDVLHDIAEHKPLIGKTVEWQRSGVGQKETRRKIKF
jgi:hypothetical protein